MPARSRSDPETQSIERTNALHDSSPRPRAPDIHAHDDTPFVPIVSKWPQVAGGPDALGTGPRARAVLLSAAWCQWCTVLKHELDEKPELRRALGRKFDLHYAEVDKVPTWLDIPGFQGLPAFAFFDPRGQLVLTRSGYLPLPELVDTFTALHRRMDEGNIAPYPALQLRRFSPDPIAPEVALADLRRLHNEIFFRINSNDGGFDSPARHPYPQTLLELAHWRGQSGTGHVIAPARVESWIALTLASAKRGTSPRLEGQPLADFDFSAAELMDLATRGPLAGPRWREAVDHLHERDPYRGIQDPVDHGFFRYAAGPGWYNPHFERRANDNLAWALLLRIRKLARESKDVAAFTFDAFARKGGVAAVQRANPFYFRLRAEERRAIEPPRVDDLWRLEDQALAALVDPARCPSLLKVDPQRWPFELWTETGEEDATSGGATPNAVGELLIALSHCRGDAYRRAARALATTVETHWQRDGLPATARLHRLAAGLCVVNTKSCPRALQSVIDITFDPHCPPPLGELSRLAVDAQSLQGSRALDP